MKRVIGIIGPIASGKDEAAEYISRSLNIPSYQISAPLKMICAERNVKPDRETLIALGTELAREKGDAYLAHYLVDIIENSAIITGMRQLGQIEYLRENTQFTLIAINASPELRFERTRRAGKPGEAKSFDEFVARERAENSPPNAQRLFECMKRADATIDNNSSLEEFYLGLDQVLTSKVYDDPSNSQTKKNRQWFETMRDRIVDARKKVEMPVFDTVNLDDWLVADATIAKRVMAATEDALVVHPRHCATCREEFNENLDYMEAMVIKYLEGGYKNPHEAISVSYKKLDGTHGFSVVYIKDGQRYELIGPPVEMEMSSIQPKDERGLPQFKNYTIVDIQEAILFEDELEAINYSGQQ